VTDDAAQERTGPAALMKRNQPLVAGVPIRDDLPGGREGAAGSRLAAMSPSVPIAPVLFPGGAP